MFINYGLLKLNLGAKTVKNIAILCHLTVLICQYCCLQDIRNQRRYRNNRKIELRKLRVTVKCLGDKRQFYESQVDYYNQYVRTCNENLQQKGR